MCTLEKGKYVSPLWTRKKLDMVSRARRVLGFGGAFPPYEGLIWKFNKSRNFKEAFSLSPIKKNNTELPKEGLKQMALEHEIVIQVPRRKKTYFSSGRLERDWRKI